MRVRLHQFPRMKAGQHQETVDPQTKPNDLLQMRVTNAWNSLLTEFDFASLKRFRRAIVNFDFSAFTKRFSHCINV